MNIKMKPKVNCVCLGTDKIERHHLFRKGIRKRWKQLKQKKIVVYWKKEDVKEVYTSIPVDAYVKICECCHKLSHPENLNFHLNQLVVEKLNGKNDTKSITKNKIIKELIKEKKIKKIDKEVKQATNNFDKTIKKINRLL